MLVNDERPALWEVTTESVADASVAPGYYEGGLRAISGRLRVDERGFVRSVDATYRIQKREARGGDERRFRTTFTVDGVGETSVSEPSWTSVARDRRPVVSASLVDDGQYVELTVTDGNPIEPDSFVSVAAGPEGGTYDCQLDDSIAVGETVFLYPDGTDSFPSLRLARGGRPSTPPSRDFSGAKDVWARRATLQYFKISL